MSLGQAVVDVGMNTAPLQRQAAAMSGTLRTAILGSAVGNIIADGVSFITRQVANLGKSVFDLVIGGGISRALNIDDARAKLRGLGHDTETVERIMDNALASVKGTAFGLDAAATVAASAVAAGIKPGRELERTLKAVADTSTIAGGGMAELGSIFNKVAASNRLTLSEVNQLSDRGVPILSFLADQFGVTQAAAREMVTAGEVDFMEFRGALEDNIGGAALKSGETLRGTLANIRAAFSRVGATLITTLLPTLKDLGADVITAADALGERLQPHIETFGEWVANTLVPAVKDFAGFLKNDVVPVLGDVASILGSVVGWIRDNWTWVSTLLVGVTAMVVAYQAWVTAIGIWTAITRIAVAVQVAWNAAMALNPIGVIALAIIGLVAAITYFVTQTETGRKVWETVTSAIGAAASWLWESAIKPAFDAIVGAFNVVAGVVTWWWSNIVQPYFTLVGNIAMWLWESAIKPAFDLIVGGIQVVAGIVTWMWRTVWRPTFQLIGSIVGLVWDVFIKPAFEGMKLGIEVVAKVITWWWSNIVNPYFTLIGKIAMWLWRTAIKPSFNFIKSAIDVVGGIVKWLWTNAFSPYFTFIGKIVGWLWRTIIKPTFNLVSKAIGVVIDWVKRLAEGFKIRVNQIRGFIDNLRDRMVSVRDSVRNRIRDMIRFFTDLRNSIASRINTIRDRFNSLRDRIRDAFNSIRSSAETVWRKVANTIRKPINWVISNVYDDGIRKLVNNVAKKVGLGLRLPFIKTIPVFHTGGPVPGRDEMIAKVLGGEHVLSREQVAQIGGHAAIDRMLDPRSPGQPQTGAPWDDLFGWVKSSIKSVADMVSKAVRGALKPLVSAGIDNLVRPLLKNIPGLNSFPGNALKAGTNKLLTGIINWFGKDDTKNPISTGRDVGTGSSALLQGMARFVRLFAPGMRVVSGYRPGDPLYHGRHRAIDMGFSDRSEYSGGGQARVAANAIKRMFKGSTLELIWDFLGSSAVYNGRDHFFTGSSAGPGTHNDHIHWAFGGTVGQLNAAIGRFDSGGFLPPGWSLAFNGTGQSETVLTNAQLGMLTRRGSDGASATSPQSIEITINVSGVDPSQARRTGDEIANQLLSRMGQANLVRGTR